MSLTFSGKIKLEEPSKQPSFSQWVIYPTVEGTTEVVGDTELSTFTDGGEDTIRVYQNGGPFGEPCFDGGTLLGSNISDWEINLGPDSPGTEDFTIEVWTRDGEKRSGGIVYLDSEVINEATGEWNQRYLAIDTPFRFIDPEYFVEGNNVNVYFYNGYEDADLNYSEISHNYTAVDGHKVLDWNHIAINRKGENTSVYVNGKSIELEIYAEGDYIFESIWDYSNARLYARNGGMVGQVRYTKGVALYEGKFIQVPTEPFYEVAPSATPQISEIVIYPTSSTVLVKDNIVPLSFLETEGILYSASGGPFDEPYIIAPVDDVYIYEAELGNLSLGQQDFTVELWVRTSATAHDERTMFSMGSGLPFANYQIPRTTVFFMSDTGSGSYEFQYSTNTPSSNLILESPAITVGQWRLLTICRKGIDINYYVDESLVTTVTDNTTPLDWPTAMNLSLTNIAVGSDFNDYGQMRVTVGAALVSGSSRSMPTAPFVV